MDMTEEEKKAKQLEAEKRYTAKDPERRREQKRRASKKWRLANPEKAREATIACDKARKARNPEAFLAKQRAYRIKYSRKRGIGPRPPKRDPAEQHARDVAARKKWVKDNPEQMRAHYRKCADKRRREQPEKIKAINKRWRYNHPDCVREWNIKMKHQRRTLSKLDTQAWRDTVEVFNNQCAYCLEPATTLEHIHPVKLGGDNAEENCVPACNRCNSSKSKKTLLHWLMKSQIAQESLAHPLFNPAP